MAFTKLPVLFVIPDLFQSNLWRIDSSLGINVMGPNPGLAVENYLARVGFSEREEIKDERLAWLHPLDADEPAYWTRLNLATNLQGSILAAGSAILDHGFGRAALVRSLIAAAGPGWTTSAWGYDWRQSFQTLGPQLAQWIIANAYQSGPNAILAVGYGALVAQWAMALLKQQGQDGLIARVIAVAPIFSGSYALPQTFRFQESAFNFGVTPFGRGNRNVATIIALIRAALTSPLLLAYRAALVSWPSLYDTLPDPALSDDASDLQRSQAWLASTWASAPTPPSASLLAAAQARQAVLHSAAYAPDRAKWSVVAVADSAQSTPGKLIPGFNAPYGTPPDLTWFWQLPDFTRTANGDGRCTLASQNPYQLPQLVLKDQNWDAPIARPFLQRLLQLLQAQPAFPELLTGFAG